MKEDLQGFSSEERLENEKDRRIAVDRLKENLPPIPLAEVVRQLDLREVAGERSPTSESPQASDRRSTPERA